MCKYQKFDLSRSILSIIATIDDFIQLDISCTDKNDPKLLILKILKTQVWNWRHFKISKISNFGIFDAKILLILAKFHQFSDIYVFNTIQRLEKSMFRFFKIAVGPGTESRKFKILKKVSTLKG